MRTVTGTVIEAVLRDALLHPGKHAPEKHFGSEPRHLWQTRAALAALNRAGLRITAVPRGLVYRPGRQEKAR